MFLNSEIKAKITAEYENFKKDMYGSKRLRKETPEANRKPGEIFREDLDAFYTPSELTIQMIEKFDCDDLSDKKILDPCCGSGNLLAACIIAGANPKNIYGNEFDPDMVKACKKRLNNICRNMNLEMVPTYNIHEGDALLPESLNNFNKNYEDWYQQRKTFLEQNRNQRKIELF